MTREKRVRYDDLGNVFNKLVGKDSCNDDDSVRLRGKIKLRVVHM